MLGKQLQNLVNHFETIENLMNANFEEIISINEIGEKIADSLLEYFSDDTNRLEIQRLKDLGSLFKIIIKTKILL